MSKEDMLARMAQAIIDGRKEDAQALALEAVAGGLDLLEVIEKGYVPGLQKVGELWEKGEYFLPELISSAECMKAAMSVLQPELKKAHLEAPVRGRVVIGTIEGDIHDIGKNLVASMMQAHGFDVQDLGADVKLERFIETAEETGADFICLSSLLTTTMLNQKKFMELLKSRNLAGRFKVLVGGAPVTQRWASEIGADGYAENAPAAVRLALELMGK
ncbi:MAG: dimethylamine corrinoid protein 3 [Candidatus Aminicenantes bacterium RBG_16_63_16]|nr:MAG: dimethylamine corrinoid protein 3 [Candidatus Aminicenantes bacterium RBG_16_63_16]